MKEIILICILVLILYFSAIILVQTIKGISTKEAQQIVLAFIKDCISTSAPTPVSYFPVFIGVDENGYPHADVIEKEFYSLNDIFGQFYFHSCGKLQNRIWYSFNVSNPLKEMTDYDLIQYCESVCDKIIHRYMHKKDPSTTHVNNLVSIQYLENILTVYIATTYDGTIENSNQSLQTRSIYNQANISNNTTITESWSDK